MEEPFVFSDRDGWRISAVLTHPPSDTDKGVVLCHGLLGFKDSVTNRTLTRLLSERGVATLRFDFFGHGSSEGNWKMYRESLLWVAATRVR